MGSHPGHGKANPELLANMVKLVEDPDHARKMQEKSRAAVAQNRKLKTDEALTHAADVWKAAGQAIGIEQLADLSEGATTAGIARAADAVVAQSLAAILSGDKQFVPQHGKEAVEMAKAMSAIARDYKARAQLERLEQEALGKAGGKTDELAKNVTELATKLRGIIDAR